MSAQVIEFPRRRTLLENCEADVRRLHPEWSENDVRIEARRHAELFRVAAVAIRCCPRIDDDTAA